MPRVESLHPWAVQVAEQKQRTAPREKPEVRGRQPQSGKKEERSLQGLLLAQQFWAGGTCHVLRAPRNCKQHLEPRDGEHFIC